jgi:hypothetical protein
MSSIRLRIVQDPDAKLDYSGTWADEFPAPRTIVTSTWTVYRDGVVSAELEVYSDAWSGLGVSWWLRGGVLDADYQITNHVVLDNGAEDDRTIDVLIRAA